MKFQSTNISGDLVLRISQYFQWDILEANSLKEMHVFLFQKQNKNNSSCLQVFKVEGEVSLVRCMPGSCVA